MSSFHIEIRIVKLLVSYILYICHVDIRIAKLMNFKLEMNKNDMVAGGSAAES